MGTKDECMLPNDTLCSKAAIREAIAGVLELVMVGENEGGELQLLLVSFSTHCPSSPS